MDNVMPVVPIVTRSGEGERWIPPRRTAHRCLCVVGVAACVPFLFLVPVVGLLLWRGLRPAGFTLEVDPEGVTYHGVWRNRRVRWEQVRRFSVEMHHTGEGSVPRIVGLGGDGGPRRVVSKSWLFGVDDLHDAASWLNEWRTRSLRARRAA